MNGDNFSFFFQTSICSDRNKKFHSKLISSESVSKMFRQSATKLTSPLSSFLSRGSLMRNCSSSTKKRPEPLCSHHKELVPPFNEVCKLKSFELKSDCTTFHMTTAGYDPCPSPCPPPCPPPKSKGPCPDDVPCGKKWWQYNRSYQQEQEEHSELLSKSSPFSLNLNKMSFSWKKSQKPSSPVINFSFPDRVIPKKQT